MTPTQPRVIGIDTASNRMHWSSTFPIGPDNDMYGWTSCSSKDPDERRAVLIEYAKGLFDSLNHPTAVYCEEPLALQNGKTTRLLGLAAGSIYAGFHLANLDAPFPRSTWSWVDQSTWKKQILGRGRKPDGYGDTLPKAKREKAWVMDQVIAHPLFQGTDPVKFHDFVTEQDLCDAWSIMQLGTMIERGELPRRV